jgi:hemoglobin-like flavoprotein
MTLDVTALRESFDLVVERSPDLTRRFYATLFERSPQVRPLFGRSMEKQEEMLTRALVAVLDRIEDGVWLTDTLRALGAKHVDYGVTEEMYPWVGDALISTLAEIAGDAWTPRFATAWRDAYATISGAMIEGARSVSEVDALVPSTEPAPVAGMPA